MEAVVSFVGGFLRYLLMQSVFYAVGCGVIKLLTLGRYPSRESLRKEGGPEFCTTSFVGLLTLVGGFIGIATLLG